MPNLKLSNIALLEFHDAVLDELIWQQRGACALVFQHIAVYKFVAHEHYEVWSCSATLELAGVSHLEVDGAFSQQDWVSDLEAFDASGAKFQDIDLTSKQAVSKVMVKFTNGALITIELTSANVATLEPITKLEDWFGPLRTIAAIDN